MIKRNVWIGISAAVVVLVLVGLTSQNMMHDYAITSSSGSSATMMQRSFDSSVGGSPEMMADYSLIAPENPSAGLTAAETDQKIIKTGYLDVKVNSVAEVTSKIITYANGNGGFVQDSSTDEREDGSHYGNVTVRLPSANFDTAMDAIASYATIVQTRSSQGQDVTEQYTDLEARLGNAQAQEAEYLNILKKASSVEDILAVQQYLGQVRQEIESYQGQIKYLSNQTSYSTITVSLSEASALHLPTKAFRPLDTLKDAIQGLGALAQRLIEGIIYLVIIGGGTLLPVGLVVWLIVRLVQNKKRK